MSAPLAVGDAVIRTEKLGFSYCEREVTEGGRNSTWVQHHEIFGFLGPSGAGKSTTQTVLIGLLSGYLGRVLALPIGLALLLRPLIPRVQDMLLAEVGFDLTPYYPLVTGGYLMTAPGMVGMVIGFLFLDERDARTLTALRTTPLSMRQYLGYRVALPLLLGTASTLIGYPLTGLTPLPLTSLLAIVVIASLSAPLLALVLAVAAPNKVAGFAVVKVLNAVNLLPIVAYFVPRPVQYAAGVLPTYWPMRAFWSAAVGEPFGAYLVVGAVVSVLALLFAARLFDRRLLRHG